MTWVAALLIAVLCGTGGVLICSGAGHRLRPRRHQLTVNEESELLVLADRMAALPALALVHVTDRVLRETVLDSSHLGADLRVRFTNAVADANPADADQHH